MNNNPLLESFNTKYDTAPFSRIKEEHYKPAFEIALKQARSEIKTIKELKVAPDFTNTIEALEKTGKKLGTIASIFFNLTYAETSDGLQSLASELSPILTEFNNEIHLDEELFAKIDIVYKTIDTNNLSTEQQMLLNETYKSFQKNGINLPKEQKERYKEISKRLSELTVKFGQNVLAETNDFVLHITKEEDLKGLPEAVIESAKETATSKELEGWAFTLQFPSYFPFMKYAENRTLRKKLFMAHASRCNRGNDKDNKSNIKEIVALRLEKAQLLGYKTYADMVLEERMAKSAPKVNGFLSDLFEASIEFAKKEKAELDAFAKQKGLNDEVQRWDWAYYAEMLRKEKYDISESETKPYFQLENVVKGVFGLATKLYGITFKQVEDIDVYHKDVKTYEVYEETGAFLSVLYLDFHPRETKQGGAWMTSYKDQHKENGEDFRPHISLVCNFTKPTNTSPSLLTFEEVETFLHEFGHGLHGMLSKCTYESLSGTSVYRDFVELPSQIMENWALEKEWLEDVAIHYKTGAVIPQELIDKLIASKNFHSAYQMIRQLSFGICDMAWHSVENGSINDVIEFEQNAMSKTELFPSIEGTCFSTAFSHIFSGGYAAGYYGYKWAEVLDADAFSVFKKKGIYNKDVAKLFKEAILEKGGTEHPDKLYKDFRGKEPSVEPLLERSGLIQK